MERKVNVVEDLNGKKTVFIHDILFKGKRAVNWDEVEKYLRQYVGEFYQIEDCNKMIYIGSDLPDEYTHSNYTRILKGANAKAKANATQGLPELLKIATNEVYEDNRKEKHSNKSKSRVNSDRGYCTCTFNDLPWKWTCKDILVGGTALYLLCQGGSSPWSVKSNGTCMLAS